MSDDQRITKVERGKYPRRVEAGKRLGAISRAAKERKARDRAAGDREGDRAEEENYDYDTQNGGVIYITLLTGVGVISGLVCLYYTYKQDKREIAAEASVETQPNNNRIPQKRSTDQNLPKPIDSKPSKPTGSKLRSFDE